ncbi:MAG: extracellular solute-binding protein [Clostridiales bacterium]|nr:extracellular solute-binding protein [Clostridiales bacterium]
MKRNIVKRTCVVFVCGFLTVSEMLFVSGCKKKKPEGVKTVAGDAAWFTSTTAEIKDPYKDQKTLYYNNYMVGAYKDSVIFQAEGMYQVPDDFVWGEDSEDEYRFYNLDCYDFSGKLIRSVDIRKVISNEKQTRINDVILSGDGVNLDIVDTSSGKEKHYWASVDMETGEIGERVEAVVDLAGFQINDRTWCEGTWKIGEYSVTGYNNQDTNTYAYIISKNGQSKVVDLNAALPSADIFLIFNYLVVSEKELLLVCAYSSVKFVTMNLETGAVQNRDDDFAWLDSIVNKHIATFEGKSYLADQDGIKRINFETREIEEILSFNDCNLNRFSLSNLSLLSVKEDKYVFLDESSHNTSVSFDHAFEMEPTPSIVVLEKAEKNPNAGKAIITAASVGDTSLSYPICEAIRVFNDTNKNYYVQLDYKYDIQKYTDYSHVEDRDERYGIYYMGAADLYDQLAIDMVSGNGPDIVLNAGDIRQIQTEGHLIDLSSYINGKSGINTEDYFTNVIDAAKVDGKLLYMPVCFSVSGIPVEKENVREDQKGFTYDEYRTYLDEVIGSDPMENTRLGILGTLYPYVSDSCISGNTVNFDNESFRSLCDYVKNQYSELSEYDAERDGIRSYRAFESFLVDYNYVAPKMTLLGFPSKDGSGPLISVETSIGISSSVSSDAADGAWEFIKCCLSDDIQNKIASDYSNPMNKSVFDSSSKSILEAYNWSEFSLGIPLDESVIASYKEVLQSATVIDNADPTVLSVISEEVPAYFLDQKSMDAVLEILKNRVTTIINERSHN